MSGAHRAGDRGAATAELALSLPLLVAVTIGLVWLLSVGTAQVRMVDAARETARAAARGDGSDEAVARGLEVAPPGSRITLRDGGGRVTAVASGEVAGPGGLFAFLPAVTVRAEAVAAVEEGSWPGS
jgi:Flp pilus assembly protein TadG